MGENVYSPSGKRAGVWNLRKLTAVRASEAFLWYASDVLFLWNTARRLTLRVSEGFYMAHMRVSQGF